jgi:NAD(P)-dependent dehydrogenase (short-subunit alcohol dehydrogenase family)
MARSGGATGLQRSVALVTGAASGIGRQCALTLAGEGAAVLAADLNATGLDSLADEITSRGGRVVVFQLDITDPGACREAAQLAVTRLGALDSVVHAAGILATSTSAAGGATPMVPLIDADTDGWNRMLSVNLTGGFNVLQASFAVMLQQQRSGAAVVITSGGSVRPLPGRGAYCVSKAGLAMLVKMFADELAPSIRVNAVAPGVVETPMTAELIASGSAALSAAPLGRHGKPDDIAAAVRFLLSDESSFITGKTLYVDGGVFSG